MRSLLAWLSCSTYLPIAGRAPPPTVSRHGGAVEHRVGELVGGRQQFERTFQAGLAQEDGGAHVGPHGIGGDRVVAGRTSRRRPCDQLGKDRALRCQLDHVTVESAVGTTLIFQVTCRL